MAFVFGSGDLAIITVDSVDISQAVESVKFDRKAKDERHHVLNKGAVVTLVHAPEYTVTVKGLIDPTVAGVFTSNLTTTPPQIPLIYQPQGAGGPTRTCTVRVTDYSEDTDGSKTGMFDATLAIDGAVVDS